MMASNHKQKKPRSKTPRKKHTIKHMPGQLPITIRFSGDLDLKLKMAPLLELEKFRSGNADSGSWHTVMERLCIGVTLAKFHFNEAEMKIMADAVEAMCQVSDRHKRMQENGAEQTWGASQDELKFIVAGVVLTDDMRDNTSRREQREATIFVYQHNALQRAA